MSDSNRDSYLESLGNLWGRVKIDCVFQTGEIVTHVEEDNLIVSLAKNIVLSQLFYSSGTGDPISYAKVGVGGATDVGGTLLKTPAPSMTDLYAPQLMIPVIKSAEDMSTPKITLIAQVGNSQGNGLKINEAGFFTGSGKLFNIKTFPYITKNSSFAINIRWDIGM